MVQQDLVVQCRLAVLAVLEDQGHLTHHLVLGDLLHPAVLEDPEDLLHPAVLEDPEDLLRLVVLEDPADQYRLYHQCEQK